jgi:hypothetical protein
MSLKLYNADTYLKTKYQADEPDTEFVRIYEFVNTSVSCCGLRYSGTPLNRHAEYNALTDKSQAAEPEKSLSEIKSACTTSCRPVVLQYSRTALKLYREETSLK